MPTPRASRRSSTPYAPLSEQPALLSFNGSPSSLDAVTSRPRRSFVSRLRSASRGSLWRDISEEEVLSPSAERPPIPSALAPSGETVSSPLPILPMIVLSIVMLGEFLTANVATPFLLFMVEGFGGFRDEADVGYWTGILVSCFFITQFITSLLWATAAAKHGTRTVLSVSLLGSSLTCLAFGTATSLAQAMCIRLLQGVFAGAIGVGRGTIATISDPSNEGRAYAILGFAWGFGGVAGAIVGGSFENPAKKWPGIFENIPLFVKYPYLLPTTIAASITFIGAILSLFLAPDGGPREGAIRLPPEKVTTRDTIPEEPSTPVEESESVVGSLRQKLSRKVSDYFTKRGRDAGHAGISPSRSGNTTLPLSPRPRHSSNTRARTQSRTSRADGSAYGYEAHFRNRLASNMSRTLAGRHGSLSNSIMRRRPSNAMSPRNGMEQRNEGELNFAQRLLMANEFAVTNIADLWVAAAINADNEDVFLSDTEVDDNEIPFQDDDDVVGESLMRSGRLSSSISTPRLLGGPSPSRTGKSSMSPHTPSNAGSSATPRLGSPRRSCHRPSLAQVADGPTTSQRRVSSSVPVIFSHTGLRSPPAHDAQLPHSQPLLPLESDDIEAGHRESLAPISEAQGQSESTQHAHQPTDEPLAEGFTEKQPSVLSQMPIMIIIQYGLLALHSTTHDQVFLSYLVSKYSAGGLNLNAGHFAQLIALMSLAQIAYQFYLYPNMGPPRGRFSHLAMFRIGSLLFIPAYLSVILYRPLASAENEGNVFLMAALVLSTALRYAGITFAYTAVAILLNYLSPPHILGYANGVAQSIVSFARFLGPILGGILWSVSVDGNPSGYPFGFLVCAAVTGFAVAFSLFIH